MKAPARRATAAAKKKPTKKKKPAKRAPARAKPTPRGATLPPLVVFEPNPGPQTKLLESMAREVGYGGAAGGGKSMGIIAIALRWVHHPAFRGLILRREIPQLRDLVDKSKRLYPLFGGVFNHSTHTWTFPSGATIWMNHVQHADDWEQYQGHEFHFVAFDELTTFTLKQFVEISARVRGATAGLPRMVRWTSNPGGKGHDWVVARYGPWLDPACKVAGLPDRFDADGKQLPPAAPGQVLWVTREGDVDVFHPWPVDDCESRQFIPALLSDNPKLTSEDPGYARALKNLDPVRRAQLERGDWLIKPAAGLYFKRGWFHVLAALPRARMLTCRYWDRAATVDGDWTVGVKMGKLPDGLYVVLDVVRFRGTPGDVQKNIRATAELDGKGVAQVLEQDPAQAGVSEMAALVKLLAGYPVRVAKPSGDKVKKAGPFSAQVEAGNVYILFDGDRAPAWLKDFWAELEAFPDADHDDQVDAAGGAFSWLAPREVKAKAAELVTGEERRSMDGW